MSTLGHPKIKTINGKMTFFKEKQNIYPLGFFH